MQILSELCSLYTNCSNNTANLLSDPEYGEKFFQTRIELAEMFGVQLTEKEKAQQNIVECHQYYRHRKIKHCLLGLALIYQAASGAQNISHISSAAIRLVYTKLNKMLPGSDTSLELHTNSIIKSMKGPQVVVALDAIENELQQMIDTLLGDDAPYVHKFFKEINDELGTPIAFDGSHIPTLGSKEGAKIHVGFDFSLNRIVCCNLSNGHGNERNYAEQLIHEYTENTSKKPFVLADSGYLSFNLMKSIEEMGGFYLFKGRVNTSCKAAKVISAINEKGKHISVFEGKLFKKCDKNKKKGETIDFLLEDFEGTRYRVIRRRKPNEDSRKSGRAAFVYFLTNIPYGSYSGVFISMLYHFRWTIENLFKDLKSGNGLHKSTFKSPFATQALIKASILAFFFKYLFALIAAKASKTLDSYSIHKIMRHSGFPLDTIFSFLLRQSPHKRPKSPFIKLAIFRDLKEFLSFCKCSPSSQRTKNSLKDLNDLAKKLLEMKAA